MLVPLYGCVEGDTMGVLVLADGDMRLSDVAARLRESARVRVDTRGEWQLAKDGRVLDPELTVAAAGLTALSRVDLVRRA